ncbi:MAG: hypothetical protein ACM3QW_03645 [Ignavibacteriales bacterium]
MKRKLALILAVIMLCSLGAGCDLQKSYNTDSGTVSVDNGKITYTGSDGTISESSVAEDQLAAVSLPEGYPLDICPLVSDAKPIAVNKTTNAEGTTYWVTVTSLMQALDVYNFYCDQLQPTDKYGSNDFFTMSANKGGYSISLIIKAEYAHTTICITITPAPAPPEPTPVP